MDGIQLKTSDTVKTCSNAVNPFDSKKKCFLVNVDKSEKLSLMKSLCIKINIFSKNDDFT